MSLGTSWYSKLAQLQFLHMAPTVESFLQVFKAPQQPPAAFGFLFPGPPNLDGHCVLSHAIPRRPRRPASRLQPVTRCNDLAQEAPQALLNHNHNSKTRTDTSTSTSTGAGAGANAIGASLNTSNNNNTATYQGEY